MNGNPIVSAITKVFNQVWSFRRTSQPPLPPPEVALVFNIGYGLLTFDRIGTLERETEIMRRLAKKGWPVSLYTFDKTAALPILNFKINVYPQWPFRFPPKTNLLYPLLMPLLRFFSGRRAQVLITHQSFNVWHAIFCGWLWHARVIIRCGYVMGEAVESRGESGRYAKWLLFQEKWTFQRAAYCLVPTRELAQWAIKNYRLPPDKIAVVPNFVDTAIFCPEQAVQPTIDLLCVGRLAPQKRLPLILEAIRELNVSLTLIGDGALREEIKTLAKRLGVSLTLIPPVPHHALPGYFRRARIYLIASQWEGHPKSLIEAMACGCACIGTRSPGIQNQIDHYRTGILVDADPRKIKNAILSLLADEPLRRTLGDSARQYALENWSLEKVWGQYERILEKILAPSPVSAATGGNPKGEEKL